MMKEKIQHSPRKIKLPSSDINSFFMDCKENAEIFSVSNFMVRTAFKLRKEKGILAVPDLKGGNELPDSVKNLGQRILL